MNEPDNARASRPLAVLLGGGLLAFAAHQAFGPAGLQAVLVLALGAVALAALHRVSGRSFAGVALPRREHERQPPAPVKDDAWRSERWVREAVERGLRSLDAWRFDEQAT